MPLVNALLGTVLEPVPASQRVIDLPSETWMQDAHVLHDLQKISDLVIWICFHHDSSFFNHFFILFLAKEQVVGRRVQITGLTKTPEFNGQWGKAFAKKTQRFLGLLHTLVFLQMKAFQIFYTLKCFSIPLTILTLTH